MSSSRQEAPWTNVYGLTRSLIALGTASSLLFTSADDLFRPLGPRRSMLMGGLPLARASLFALVPETHLEWARLMAVAALILVATGWRPRITGLLHWWISFSYMMSTSVLEGGDQLAANITLLLLPVALSDPRRFHWDAPPVLLGARERVVAAVGGSSFTAVRLQMAVVYLHAAIGKIGAAQWKDGTAVYYWFLHPSFGAPDWLRPLILPLISNGPAVLAMTWGTVLLELLLAAAIVMRRKFRPPLLIAGVLFHMGIALVHGLVAFSAVMTGALILYLRDPYRPFTLSAVKAVKAWASRLGSVTRLPLPQALPVFGHARPGTAPYGDAAPARMSDL